MEKMQEAGERRVLDGVEQSKLTYLFRIKGVAHIVRSLVASLVATESTQGLPMIWRLL